jgi:hypothetical protein
VLGTFLIGCAFLLLMVGCAGPRSETSKEQQPTEATTKEQTRSPEATASEEARCDGTRTIEKHREVFATNDLPDCPNKGGLLLGTDKPDKLDGKEGEDEIRGLGATDQIFGGVGKDVIYGGPGDDSLLVGDDGADVIYGGDGNDSIVAFADGQPDNLYCGIGKDEYHVEEKIGYVSRSCEKKFKLKGIH